MLLRTLTCSREEAEAVLARLAETGLQVREMPLKSLPKGMHWHVNKLKEKGTLEATWNDGALRFDVRSNRDGDWQSETVNELRGP